MSEMHAVASTELGDLPVDWPVQRFDSLFAVQQGKQVSKTNRIGENQRPFLRTKNVFWGELDLTDLDEMHFTKADEKRLALHPGDLLVCEGGDIGRTAIWNGALPRCYFQNHLHRARLRDKGAADSHFALYWLWYAFEIGSVYFGRGNVTTIPNLSQSKLCELPIPVPPLPEQRKIAGVLGVVQRAIEQQERLLALTTELKKTLLHQLFTAGLRGETQKQTDIGPVPESWRVSRLDDFCVLQRGYDITKKEQIAGNVPVVSSGGIASYHNVAKVKGPGVVVGRKGTLGKVHYLDVDFWPHDTTLWVKDFKGHDPLFTSYFLKTLRFERYNSGASNPTLNRNTVHAELVAFPQKEEQAEIGRILKTVDDKARINERKIKTLTSLFYTLLHQLMTAKIRVQNLDLPELESKG
jgi:type I restriction enzyme, S subunit